MSRWGMPYEPEGIHAIVACMDRRALQPIGNAFAFCYLDTTSYASLTKRTSAASKSPSPSRCDKEAVPLSHSIP